MTTLQVMKPMGRFGTAISEIPKNYIVFTAGSGITPILSHDQNTFSQRTQ